MSKYVLLVLLNLPFIVYGILKASAYYKDRVYSLGQLLTRLLFWLGCLAILISAKPLYNFLNGNRLTDSPPLSLADVVLTTASLFSLTMIIRLYARLEKAERKITQLNEVLALKTKPKDS